MKSNRNLYLKLGITLSVIVLVGALLFIGMYAVEKYIIGNNDNNRSTFGQITYEGKTYEPKKRLKTFLMIGVDEFGVAEESGSTSNIKMADFLSLFVFDEENKTCKLIHINRDTMMEVPVLGPMGDKAGTRYQQIAWAHTYGSGMDDSCRNTANAVSALLGDVTVDNYMSITMDAVPIINDLVGGVTVDVTDDFSAVDPTIEKGERITLKGSQALTYVRARGGVGDETNIERMARQKQYMQAFAEAVKTAYAENNDLMLEINEALSGYMVTDSTVGELTQFAEYISTYELIEVTSPEGESKKGEMYMEHTVNETSLQKLIIETFYTELKEK